MNTADVIVLGVGAMGSATCLELARRGVKVVGLEQFDIPHARGSSHGYSRAIRLSYSEHPDYVPLLRRAYELWDDLESESGQRLLYRTGGLYMSRPDGDAAGGALTAAKRHGLEHQWLDRSQLAARYPQFHVPDDHVGFFEPTAGFLVPEKAIAAQAERAMRRGAVLRGHEPVRTWSSDAKGVTVVTDRATYHAGHLIVTAGAWAASMVESLGVKLTVTRQVLGWVWPRRCEPFELGTLPVWQISCDDGRGCYYGFPMMPDNPGFKLAHHHPGEPTDPDRADRAARPEDEHTFRPALKRYIPEADGPLLAMRICLYTNTPDQHFIVDRHPLHANVSIACGFSGHGFKLASVMGEALADLATDGRTNLPIGFLGLSRFGTMRV